LAISTYEQPFAAAATASSTNDNCDASVALRWCFQLNPFYSTLKARAISHAGGWLERKEREKPGAVYGLLSAAGAADSFCKF